MVISGTFVERRVIGKVVGVHDGDTATVLDADKTQYKVRFNGIDAPELKMDFGQKSKQNLSDLIFGKEVTLVFGKKDKYGRLVGNIFINGKDINLEQIKTGSPGIIKSMPMSNPKKIELLIRMPKIKPKQPGSVSGQCRSIAAVGLSRQSQNQTRRKPGG
jgi:endonuclease YncB( thermonuclease family)